jgi:hypothetical protein
MVSKVLSMIFGLAISVYMAFYLYRKYSKEMNAFIALMVAGLIGGGIASLVPKTIIDSSFSHDLITIAATLAAYVFGWYAAKMSEVKIFLFGERWMKAFMIIGIVIYCSYIIVTLAGHPLQ